MITNSNSSPQIKSKSRVEKHGEVFTAEREVKAMCDLVKEETEKFESRFLEPACGDGNFLVEILSRKLQVLKTAYQNSINKYEENSIVVAGSLYGIELLLDNTLRCRERLFDLWNKDYTSLFQNNCKDDFRKNIEYIFQNNIICGNTLTSKLVDCNQQDTNNPIIFSEWTYEKNILSKKNNYPLEQLLEGTSLFSDFQMDFDVIIGNPPYQVNDCGNGKSASPIYQHFIELAKKLNPHYITMLIPSRWFAGGKNLDGFRKNMLEDNHISHLVDYENFRDVFSEIRLTGGACYFLRDRDYEGPCLVRNFSDSTDSETFRSLNEFDTFVRNNKSVKIIRKVRELTKDLDTLDSRVFPRYPFIIPTNYTPKEEGIPCWFIKKIGLKYADPEEISDVNNILQKWKLLAPKSPIAGQTDFSKPIAIYYNQNLTIAKPGECCTSSYIVLGAFDTEQEILSYKSYILTRTVRFLLLQAIVSQDVTKKSFCFVPDVNDYTFTYTDEYLCKKWNLSENDWNHICSRIGTYRNKIEQ